MLKASGYWGQRRKDFKLKVCTFSSDQTVTHLGIINTAINYHRSTRHQKLPFWIDNHQGGQNSQRSLSLWHSPWEKGSLLSQAGVAWQECWPTAVSELSFFAKQAAMNHTRESSSKGNHLLETFYQSQLHCTIKCPNSRGNANKKCQVSDFL